MLITVFCVILVMLPLGTQGIQRLHDWVLVQKARQYIAETLPASYMYLDISQLANGQPVLDDNLAIVGLQTRFQTEMPAQLGNRLRLISVQVTWRALPFDPNHWMGDDQPRRIPVVTINAALADSWGQNIPLEDSIEMLMD